jgi:hypothetical protein
MRFFISYRFLSIAAAIIISLLPVAAAASIVVVADSTFAARAQPENIYWD